jgi:uncharacterized protein (TIGR03435 family)
MLGALFQNVRVAFTMATLMVCVGSYPCEVRGQGDSQFEAATVRRVETGRPPTPDVKIAPAYLTAPAASLQYLITQAFGLEDYQLLGTTGWMELESYSINAITGKPVGRTEMMLMLRRLLNERFHLRAHHDTKTAPVYALVVDSGGHKLTPLNQMEEPSFIQTRGDQATRTIGSSIQDLARHLNRVKGAAALGRPVVDRTGLHGLYRIRLTYVLEKNPDGSGGRVEINFHSALPKQLGLRLEPAKAAIDVLVVDSAEKPRASEQ